MTDGMVGSKVQDPIAVSGGAGLAEVWADPGCFLVTLPGFQGSEPPPFPCGRQCSACLISFLFSPSTSLLLDFNPSPVSAATQR